MATLHPKIKSSKPNICLKVPSWTPRQGPRRAQDSPRWAQDGPKKGRRRTIQTPKIIPGALLGPSWGHLGLNLALSSPSCNQLRTQAVCYWPSRPQQDLQTITSPVYCQTSDGNADPNNQHTKEPTHQPTSLRGWLGGMRGTIKSAAGLRACRGVC